MGVRFVWQNRCARANASECLNWSPSPVLKLQPLQAACVGDFTCNTTRLHVVFAGIGPASCITAKPVTSLTLQLRGHRPPNLSCGASTAGWQMVALRGPCAVAWLVLFLQVAVLAGVRHPCVVTLHGACLRPPYIFLVEERMATTLAARLHAPDAPRLSVRGACRALCFACLNSMRLPCRHLVWLELAGCGLYGCEAGVLTSRAMGWFC